MEQLLDTNEPIFTQKSVYGQLKESIVEIKFTTTKGSDCTKIATLIESYLPPRPIVLETDSNDELKKPKKVNTTSVSFWSLEDNSWRSARVDNINTIRLLDAQEIANISNNAPQKRLEQAEV